MNIIETYDRPFDDTYLEDHAEQCLTDEEYHEFQGLWFNDKIRYLAAHGRNLIPTAKLNGIHV